MQRIFDEVIDDMLRECQPEERDLILEIPLIRGGAEDVPDDSGWVIENSWYKAHRIAHYFWARVLELCDRDGIERRSVGICTGEDKNGRPQHFKGYVFNC